MYAEFAETLPNVGTKRVVPNPINDSSIAAKPRSCDRDVGRTTANRLSERRDFGQGNVVLLGIHVH